MSYNKDKLLQSKNFCMIPWTHLHTWPDGRILTCCMSPSNKPMGNLKEVSLEQAWNSDQQKQLRKDLLTDKQNSICNRCHEMERNNISTTRQWANKHLANHMDVVETPKTLNEGASGLYDNNNVRNVPPYPGQLTEGHHQVLTR